MPDIDQEYINSTNYKKLSRKIMNLHDVSYDLTNKSLASRKLRYAEIDIEVERKASRIAPDEIFVPLHIIDTNIRREQSAYIQYITQSPRAVILEDTMDKSFDLSLLEADLTGKLRYKGWQLPAYANIDGFQANGYGVMEVVQELDNVGELADEYAQYGDFSFIADTRDIQKTEMVSRSYYFTKSKLVELSKLDSDDKWDSAQLEKLYSGEPNDEQAQVYSGSTTDNRSLYKVEKVMFRVKGVVQVGWCAPIQCDDWLRNPRPLYVGRRKLNAQAAKAVPYISQPGTNVDAVKQMFPALTDTHIQQIQSGMPPSDEEYETQFPYFLYPYLISENDTIANLKGRVFLDQDTQNAASSLMSATLTQARRASGLYFSKDTTDPNDDFLMQKNVNFKTGCLINGKIKEFKLDPPAAEMFSAINLLVSANAQETSQINFAETNRQNDSRKTATAIKSANAQAQELSGVQVTLYSIAQQQHLEYKCGIIKSRVLTGLIKVRPELMPLYQRTWLVKPSGDVDVIQKQQTIAAMQQTWPVMANTPAAQMFLSDLLEMMFPDKAPKYIATMQQAQQQQQSDQAQKMQQAIGIAKQVGEGVSHLADHPEYFSEAGTIHAFPVIKVAAQQYEQLKETMQQKKGQQ